MDGFRCRSAAGAKDKEGKERCCLSLFPWSPQSPQAHFSQGLQRLVFRLFLSTLTNSLNQANILCFMHSSWDKSIYSFCANWSKWAKKGTLLRKKVHHRRLCGWDKYQLSPCDENFVCKVSPLMINALLTECSHERLHNTGKHPLLCTRKWREKLIRDKIACTRSLMIIFSDQKLFLYFYLIWFDMTSEMC